MKVSPHIFKAYDVRGKYPEELNKDTVYNIARAFGQMRQKELGKENVNLVAGRDMRLSSPELYESLKQGLVAQGVNVIEVGLASTPTYYFAVSYYGYDGGLLISASHNPKEYNGVKIVRSQAMPVGEGSGMEELRESAMFGEFSTPSRQGTITVKNGVLQEQVSFALKYANLKSIKPLKIVIDTANSMGILYLEELFKHAPQLEIVKLNEQLDGSFPAHQADPMQDELTSELRRRIVNEKADLGIATDGDGDRIFFFDNQGDKIEPAIMRGIIAQVFLRENPGATICYDIRPGKITEDMILEAGGKPSLTRVGHSLIKKQMIETGAIFGGESSGHFFVKFPHGIYEAPEIVVLKFLQELSEANLAAHDYVRPLRKYFHSGEINFKVADKDKILEVLKEKFKDAKINPLDGLTFTYNDFWFNVRPSNTESLLRLNLEARTDEIMREKLDLVKKIITEQ